MNVVAVIALIAGVAWLFLGALEMRTALDHAKRYEYKPMLGAAWYWLTVSALAFLTFGVMV